MRVIALLNIVPIAVGLGACTDDERLPGDGLGAQQMSIDDASYTGPDRVEIRDIGWAGSGCPAGSVTENLASDFHAFTLVFDSYVAEIGPGLPLSLSRRNCQLLVDLEFPQGWSYSLLDVDTRGFASLEDEVLGIQQSVYYFQGESNMARLQTKIHGPTDRDYHVRDTFDLESLVWSPCGETRALVINSSIRLVNNSDDYHAQGLITTDSIDGKVTHIYGLQWRHCGS